jgi:hypothetical protein
MVFAFLMCLLCFLVPGALMAAAARLRAFDVLALAPALSVFAMGVGALLAGFLRIPWSWWVPFAVGVVFAALLLLLPFRSRHGVEAGSVRHRDWIAWLGLGIGAVIGVVQSVRTIGPLSSISQTFDNTFHLNAVRYIVDEGNASPLFVGTLNSGGEPGFYYPSTWHAFASLLVETTGVSIPEATNVVTIVVVALAWPASLLFLMRSLSPNRYSWLVAAALSGGFAVFPLLLLQNGVLYPNLLGMAVLPAALGLIVWVLRGGSTAGVTRGQGVVLGILAAGGTALGHPNTVISLITLAIPAVLARVIWLIAQLARRRGGRSAPASGREPVRHLVLELVLFAAALLAVPFLWAVLRPTTVRPRELPQIPAGEAVLRALGTAPVGYSISIFSVVALLLSAIVLLALRKHVWLVLGYALLTVLYVAVASWPWEMRDALTGVWYNDPYRITALYPVLAIPMIGLAAGELVRLVTARFGLRRGPRAALWKPLIAAGCAALLAAPALGSRSMGEGLQGARDRFEITDDSELLTPDELAVIESIPDLVPPEDTVLVNPWTGGALTYALTGWHPSSYHLLETRPPQIDYLVRHLDEAYTDPRVCEDVRGSNAYYVLDFGTQEMNYVSHAGVYGGLLGLEEAGVAQTVQQVGEAKLLRVTACSEADSAAF